MTDYERRILVEYVIDHNRLSERLLGETPCTCQLCTAVRTMSWYRDWIRKQGRQV